MSLRQYLDQMERIGLNRETIIKALWQHSCYIEDHGLPAGFHDQQTGTDSWEAMKYGRECKRMLQEEANRQVIGEWCDGEFIRQCTAEMGDEDAKNT